MSFENKDNIIKFEVLKSLDVLNQRQIQKNTLWFIENEKLLFFDTITGIRMGFSDIVVLENDAARLALQTQNISTIKFYRIKETNKVWIYNNKWIDITGGSFDINDYVDTIKTIVQAYLDGGFMTELENKITQTVEEILNNLGGLLGGDSLQTLKIFKGTKNILPGVLEIIAINCGFTAYEIKTIKVENLTNTDKLKAFLFENNETDDVIYQSLESNTIYNNTAEVTNINEGGYIYLGVVNETKGALDDVSIRYKINVVNLKNGGMEE
jgi:hypothetical protein